MIFASKVYLFFCFRCICYILNTFTKMIKCYLFRSCLLYFFSFYKLEIFYFIIIFLYFITMFLGFLAENFAVILPLVSSFVMPMTFLFFPTGKGLFHHNLTCQNIFQHHRQYLHKIHMFLLLL